MPVQTRQKRRSKRLMAKSSKVTSANLKTTQAKSGQRPTRQRTRSNNERVRNSINGNNGMSSEMIVTAVDQQNIGRGNTQVAEQMLQRIFEDERLTPEARKLIYLWNYFNFKNKEAQGLSYLDRCEDETRELLLRFVHIFGKTILENGLYSQFLCHTETMFDCGLVDLEDCRRAVTAIEQQALLMNPPLQLNL